MTEEDQQNFSGQEEEEPHVQEPEKPERPQIIEIKTPLDRPEFDFFVSTYMKKLGLTDKKQAAIQLGTCSTT